MSDLLTSPSLYLNRELSWLAFNARVLHEALDPRTPPLERVKFLAITANNLDEFVEVRVSSFLQRIEHGSAERSPDGLSTEEELALVTQAMHSLVRDQYKCLNEELLPQLAKEAIRVLRFYELDAKAEKFVGDEEANRMLSRPRRKGYDMGGRRSCALCDPLARNHTGRPGLERGSRP